jgi:ribonuclease P protein component
MLPKSQRINRELFAEVLARGNSFHTEFFSLRLLRMNPDSREKGRFSFVVSKKVSKKAVVRNRIRRRGYAAVRNLGKHSVPAIAAGIFVKKGAVGLDIAAFQGDLAALLKHC